MNKIRYIILSCLLGMVFIFSAGGFASASEMIGKVIAMEGSVIVYWEGESGGKNLSLADDIKVKDQFQTGLNSKLVVQLDDKSFISIGPESSVKIETYEFNPETKKREAMIFIKRGQLKVKVVMKKGMQKTNFQIRTPVAKIDLKKSAQGRKAEVVVTVSRGGKTKVLTINGLAEVKPLLQSKVTQETEGQIEKDTNNLLPTSGGEEQGEEEESDDAETESSEGNGDNGGGGIVLPRNVSAIINIDGTVGTLEEITDNSQKEDELEDAKKTKDPDNNVIQVDTYKDDMEIDGNIVGIELLDDLVTNGFPDVDFTQNDPDHLYVSDDSSYEQQLPFTFNFYGTDYSSIFVNANGNLTFGSGDNTSFIESSFFLSSQPRIAPLWTDLYPYYHGEGNGAVFYTIDDTNSVIKFEWADVPYWCSNCENGFASANASTFNAMLFSNNNIAFTYNNINNLATGEESFYGQTLRFIAGISPGGNLSNASSIDLNGGTTTGAANEAIYQYFSDFSEFDLNYYGLLFTPNQSDPANGYTATPYGSNIIVSQDSIFTGASLYMATQSEIDSGAFLPTNYTYGLQVGEYISETALAAINRSAYIAYAVQVEEDIANRAALEMYRDGVGDDPAKEQIRETIAMKLYKDDIRARDAYLTQEADAQAGRVLKDSNGSWVRTQQYVLRPDDNTIQVVNATLTGNNNINTLDWRTSFTRSIQGVDIRTLPWGDWLSTKGASLLGSDPLRVNNTSQYELLSMSAHFSGSSDGIKEIRTFAGLLGGVQNINSQQLNLNGSVFTYTTSALLGSTSNSYTIGAGSVIAGQPTGYQYRINDGSGTEKQVNATFSVLGNSVTLSGTGVMTGYDSLNYNDLWHALSTGIVDSGSTAVIPSIGLNNLQISFENNTGTSLLGNRILVIYIPLSNMLWK